MGWCKGMMNHEVRRTKAYEKLVKANVREFGPLLWIPRAYQFHGDGAPALQDVPGPMIYLARVGDKTAEWIRVSRRGRFRYIGTNTIKHDGYANLF